MRILIVEDEKRLAEGVKALLEKNGYAADIAFDGVSGLDDALSGIYDMILLDIMLPKMDGLTVLRELRKEKQSTPVLLLTARSEVEDKIKGLDSGADDYLTKPFDPGELLARLRALSRRKGEYEDTAVPAYGDISLDRRSMELNRGGRTIRLGQKEFLLMEILIANKSHIVSKDTIAEKVWGPEDSTEYNSVEVYVSFLRKKLNLLGSRVQIRSSRNIGYSLEEKQE